MNLNYRPDYKLFGKLCLSQHSKFKEELFILDFIPHPIYVFLYPFRAPAHYFLFLKPPLSYNREVIYNLF
jgi:hypothetical protein